MNNWNTIVAILAIAVFVSGCGENGEEELSTFEAYWANLQEHCGEAFGGEILQRPDNDPYFTGDDELVVHFRECGEDEMKIPFHVDDDRSRTWVLMKSEDEIELRHDHRHEDGTEEDNTWYGGYTLEPVSETVQEFMRSDNPDSGWRIVIEPGEKYEYGTIHEGEWSYHLTFDLTEPVETPPAPWGHE